MSRNLVDQMTLEEKASLCSGESCWNLKPLERLGLTGITVMDGPHGLRKQIGAQDNLGVGISEPAVCYPTASAIACSFDRNLLAQMGEGIGTACVAEGVSTILGPGVNMKRSPLCGRNFEYYSEDPVVAGELAAAFIKGVESTGTGTSLKHFAVNNQETRRMTVDAIVDERALRELYLKPFEIAVKKGNPRSVMCSYNKVNGCYASEHAGLLTRILREEWGYKGLTISDWGAVHDRVMGIQAGLDLEMPGNGGINDRKIVEAVTAGRLKEEALDASVDRVVTFMQQGMKTIGQEVHYDKKEQHELAVKAARESMVLLQNRGALPLSRENRLLVVGEFALNPRYQGAGSSKINPVQVDIPLDILEQEIPGLTYAKGYSLKEYGQETVLLEAAKKAALETDHILIFAGLPEGFESEGFDRKHMRLPENQNRLIVELAMLGKPVTIVLIGGAPMELPWREDVNAILLAYLGGEGMGRAVTSLLTGAAAPCGKLAETWPVAVEDTPCYGRYPEPEHQAVYGESLFVGYRYYDSAGLQVAYPFGHGLSYTTFRYSDLLLWEKESGLEYSFSITNTGSCRAAEITFLFTTPASCGVPRPRKELRDFVKTWLEPGETTVVTGTLEWESLGYYNTKLGEWYTPPGAYGFLVASSGDSVELKQDFFFQGEREEEPEYGLLNPDYLAPGYRDFPKSEFEKLLGYPVPEAPKGGPPFYPEHTLWDARHRLVAKIILRYARHVVKKITKDEKEQAGMMMASILEMPMYGLVTSGDGMISESMLEAILLMCNGHYIKGIWKLFR